jgi:gluconolactonase
MGGSPTDLLFSTFNTHATRKSQFSAEIFMRSITMTELELTLVAEGLKFPEGPVAMADGSVILVEIEGKRVIRVATDGKISVVAEIEGAPNGAAIGPDGALYIANNGGAFEFRIVDGVNGVGPAPASHKGGSIQRIDLKTGAVTTLYTHCGEDALSSPNDLVFDRAGGFWFSDIGAAYPTHKIYGRLFYAAADGSRIECARHGLYSPNGVGLSPDETVLYSADTQSGRLWAFDISAPGRLARAPQRNMPGRVIATLPGFQRLDSLAVEANGKICVATIHNGGVTVFDPDGTFEHYAVPDPVVTNICFGGEDMRDAWITASGTGRLYKTRWPRPGHRLNFNA